jgi:ABC-type multidrug transport system permease subunit
MYNSAEVKVLIKELRDTLKTLGYCMLFLLFIPIALLMNWHILHFQWEVSGIFAPVFMAIVLIFASYSGVSIFQREKKDRALEYLFSLPMPIGKILAIKIFPRLLILMLLFALGVIFSVFRTVISDAAGIVILFFTAIFISLAVDSLANAMIGVLLVNIILYYTSIITSYLAIENRFLGSTEPLFWLSYLIPGLLVLVPLAVAFWLTLRNYDLKPLKWQAKPYLIIALPWAAVLLVFIMVFLKKYLKWIDIFR